MLRRGSEFVFVRPDYVARSPDVPAGYTDDRTVVELARRMIEAVDAGTFAPGVAWRRPPRR
jgi:hypothetical protein